MVTKDLVFSIRGDTVRSVWEKIVGRVNFPKERKGETMNSSQYHTLVRTVLLVDIPASIFLVACAFVGWPILITMHVLFAWLGIISFTSIFFVGMAKFSHKMYLSARKDHINMRIYEQQQRQNLLSPPYPKDDYQENLLLPDQPVARGTVIDGTGTGSGTTYGTTSGTSNDKRTPEEKMQAVYEFYYQFPDGSLEDGIRSLGIPKGTLSRYHDGLVKEGSIEDFPKNRK